MSLPVCEVAIQLTYRLLITTLAMFCNICVLYTEIIMAKKVKKNIGKGRKKFQWNALFENPIIVLTWKWVAINGLNNPILTCHEFRLFECLFWKPNDFFVWYKRYLSIEYIKNIISQLPARIYHKIQYFYQNYGKPRMNIWEI